MLIASIMFVSGLCLACYGLFCDIPSQTTAIETRKARVLQSIRRKANGNYVPPMPRS